MLSLCVVCLQLKPKDSVCIRVFIYISGGREKFKIFCLHVRTTCRISGCLSLPLLTWVLDEDLRSETNYGRYTQTASNRRLCGLYRRFDVWRREIVWTQPGVERWLLGLYVATNTLWWITSLGYYLFFKLAKRIGKLSSNVSLCLLCA